MNKILALVFGAFALCMAPRAVWAQEENEDMYRYSVDLNKVENDELAVELLVPESVQDNEVTFFFPRIVPGAYELDDFGRFVNQLQAFDSRGDELEVERKDRNTWLIKRAKRLARLSYVIEDTWDSEQKNPVFEPAGTSFEATKHFVLNHSGCFGFFKGKENLPYQLSIDRPGRFFGSTSLERTGGDFDTDIYQTDNYHNLIDAPIMYCTPDTLTFMIGYGEILISVYSPNGKVKAKDIEKEVRPILEAQRDYLGGIIPVERYAFLINLSDKGYKSGTVGALEHSRSSLFCFTEDAPERIAKIVRDVSAHEFFHIVTPLFIHSEEIHNFNYMEPKMSKHLWLYEGVTEYAAQHVQVKYGLSSLEDFLGEIGTKLRTSFRYKDGISLVELSKHCLEEGYSNQYNNIYYKGALTAMCLDMQLLLSSYERAKTHSENQQYYDLQGLMRDLSKAYGTNKYFEDDELFGKIIDLTYPEIRTFISKFIIGTEPLPFERLAEAFGLKYYEKTMVKEISALGGIENRALKSDSLKRFYISNYDKLDEFGRDYIGFKKDDILLTWNGRKMNRETASSVLIGYISEAKAGDELTVEVLRKKEGSEELEQVTLTATITPVDTEQEHVFKVNPEATEKQKALRRAWLGAAAVEGLD